MGNRSIWLTKFINGLTYKSKIHGFSRLQYSNIVIAPHCTYKVLPEHTKCMLLQLEIREMIESTYEISVLIESPSYEDSVEFESAHMDRLARAFAAHTHKVCR